MSAKPFEFDKQTLEKIQTNNFDEADPDVILALKKLASTGVDDQQLVELTNAIANSAPWVAFQEKKHPFTDIPSTGGPSSMSTIFGPMMLALCGADILKVSEKGVPAGAIDVFQCIPGYRAELVFDEVKDLLSKTTYVHISQGTSFAPADKKLIAIRRRERLMECPDLAIASLLAKKICVGLRTFVLDVRVGPSGNVGDLDRATEMAKKFVRIAGNFGIKCRCVLTDLRFQPQSPYLGRGEALRGLFKYLELPNDPHLETMIALVTEALNLSGHANNISEITNILVKCFSGEVKKDVLSLLKIHGANEDELERRLDEIDDFSEVSVVAEKGGVLKSIDLVGIKELVKRLYSSLDPGNEWRVWEIGILWKKANGRIEKDEELCAIRVKKSVFAQLRFFLPVLQSWINKYVHIVSEDSEEARGGQVIAVIDENGSSRTPKFALSLRELTESVFSKTTNSIIVRSEPTSADLSSIFDRAVGIKSLLEAGARPFIVEFAGMPRTGKTQCIKHAADFLKPLGLRAASVIEGASTAPPSLKKNLVAYNLWTTCYNLSKVLENAYITLKEGPHFVFLDRGLLDAICWFNFLEGAKKITKKEKKIISDFLRIDDWNGLVDLVFVFTCSPQKAFEREQANQIARSEGVVTTEESLTHLCDTYLESERCYRDDFKLISVDTTDSNERGTAFAVVREIFAAVERHV